MTAAATKPKYARNEPAQRAAERIISLRKTRQQWRDKLEALRAELPPAPAPIDAEEQRRELSAAMLADADDNGTERTDAVRAQHAARAREHAEAMTRHSAAVSEVSARIAAAEGIVNEHDAALEEARADLERETKAAAAARLEQTLERRRELVDEFLANSLEVGCLQSVVAISERDQQTAWIPVEVNLAGLGARGYQPPAGFVCDRERAYFSPGGIFTQEGGDGIDIAYAKRAQIVAELRGGVVVPE